VTAEPGGRWLAVWRSDDIELAASDDGLDWSALPPTTTRPRFTSRYSSIHPCPSVSLGADPDGRLLLVYRDNWVFFEDEFDAFAEEQRSLDGGLTWTEPVGIYGQPWSLRFLQPLALAPDDWLVLSDHNMRSVDGGRWVPLDTMESLESGFGRTASDGAGRFMLVGTESGELVVSSVYFGLDGARAAKVDEPTPPADSPDEPTPPADGLDEPTPPADSLDEPDDSQDAQGQTPPPEGTLCCPVATILLVIASTMILLAVRRRS
jgi:hypothetical protein